MSRNIPIELQKKQEAARNKTLKQIQKAIDELNEFGEIVTKKRLIEITGLSASTFSKQHVTDLLAQNRVCQFRPRTKSDPDIKEMIERHREEEASLKDKEVTILKQKIITLQTELDTLQGKYDELDDKYRRVLGECHKLQRKCYN